MLTTEAAPRVPIDRQCRTLVVEDDPPTSRAMVKLAESAGHSALPAITVASALKMLTAWQPDRVLLDLMLPDGSGARVLREIRQGDRPCRVAVVSGVLDSPLAAEALPLRPDARFRKPVDVEALSRWLRGET